MLLRLIGVLVLMGIGPATPVAVVERPGPEWFGDRKPGLGPISDRPVGENAALYDLYR